MPQVISGFREPRTAAELIELVKVFVESNFGMVSGSSDGGNSVEVTTEDDGAVVLRAGAYGSFADMLSADEMGAVVRFRKLSREAAAEPEFRATLTVGRVTPGRCEDQELDARIVSRTTWERDLKGELDRRPYQWAGVGLDDGRVLAIRLATVEGAPWEPWGEDDAEPLAVRDDLLEMRHAVWAMLESYSGLRCLGMEAGRNGESRFNFHMGTASAAIDVRDRRWD